MNINSVKIYYKTAQKAQSQKNKWTMSDSLREQIVQYAKEDAAKNEYMGEKFSCLRKSEVAKVAPNRKALIGMISPTIISGNAGDMQKMREADERRLCMLLGIPYEVKYQGTGFGSAIHVYDENGDEILTYTGGVGWHEKESQAETVVHRSLRLTYYDAYREARNAIKACSGADMVSADGVIQKESSFDCKA